MNKLSKKGLLLSAIVMAACSMPSMASASTFDGIGTHTLTSSDIGFTAAALGTNVTCGRAVFHIDVVTPVDAKITGTTFDDCTSTGTVVTVTSINVSSWTVTPVGDGFTISGINLVNHFTSGNVVTLLGNLAGATVNNATHTVTWNNATGLTATVHSGGTDVATASTTVGGTLTDDQGTLAVTT